MIATSPRHAPATTDDLRLLRRPVRGARVVVVTGSYGAGHDAAAREIAARFRQAGTSTEVHDVVDLLPLRLGRLLRAAYLTQIRRAPRSWESTLGRLAPGTRLHRWATGALRACGRRTLAVTADADLVVSTHPFASQVLGGLRERGELTAPVATYLTDPSVHALWVADGVDLNVAIHGSAAVATRALGGPVAIARPAVPTTPVAARTRRDLGLPPTRVVAVVIGGSLGIGDLGGTASELLACGVTPVVLCGHDENLRRDLASRPGVVALGWQDDVREVFTVADLVVQNAGGFMTLEALAVGVPVVSYAVLPGHGRTNAAAMEAADLVPWARSAADLVRTLEDLRAGGGPALPVRAPDVVELLAGPHAALGVGGPEPVLERVS